MQFFKNKLVDQEISMQGCPCTSDRGLYIPSRQVSWLISGLLLLMFFVFMGGYFLGQKKILEQFSSKLEQDSLSDKIYSSLYALYDTQEDESSDDQSDIPDELEQSKKTVRADAAAAVTTERTSELQKGTEAATTQSKTNYYAQLAGFGSAKPAYALAERLNKEAKMVLVKKHESKSPKGTLRYWYQVITKPFDNKDALISVVQKIKQKEHIKDIRIVTC